MVHLGSDGSGHLIVLRDVAKTYRRGSEELHVLQGVNLSVDKGDFVAFMGPSGSGKTTLLNLLGGLDVPSAGSITVAGDEISRPEPVEAHRLAGAPRGVRLPDVQPHPGALRLPQRGAAAAPLAALRGRAQASTWRPRSRSSAWRTATQHKPRELSGGQQQRVAIARAIVADPTFLLCDEPTGDLDRKSADEILDLLERLVERAAARPILMVTHDPRAAERAHATLHLDKGVLTT